MLGVFMQEYDIFLSYSHMNKTKTSYGWAYFFVCIPF